MHNIIRHRFSNNRASLAGCGLSLKKRSWSVSMHMRKKRDSRSGNHFIWKGKKISSGRRWMVLENRKKRFRFMGLRKHLTGQMMKRLHIKKNRLLWSGSFIYRNYFLKWKSRQNVRSSALLRWSIRFFIRTAGSGNSVAQKEKKAWACLKRKIHREYFPLQHWRKYCLDTKLLKKYVQRKA